MALTQCKECGNKVSKKAEACPHCGAPVKPTRYGSGILFLLVLGIVIVVLVAGLTPDSHDTARSNQTSDDGSKNNGPKMEGWKLMGGVYKRGSGINWVLIDRNKMMSEQLYRNAISHICASGTWCMVVFWTDEQIMPKGNPQYALLTEAQADAYIATFTRNPSTGVEQLLFACSVINDPSRCFSK